MPRVFRTLRRAAMVAVAAASMAGAAAMCWVFVASERVEQLTTAHLLAILGMVVLPVATFVAWVLNRRAERASSESRLEENGLFEMPAGVEVLEDAAQVVVASAAPFEATVAPAASVAKVRQVHQPHRRRRGGARATGRKP